MRGFFWTEEEDACLRRHWPTMGRLCDHMFPGRSRKAIEGRARTLNIARIFEKKAHVPKYHRWSEAEDAILRVMWPKLGRHASEHIANRNKKSCEQRAAFLKLGPSALSKRQKTPEGIRMGGYGYLPEGRVASVFDLGAAL